ncbi:MAG: SAM-dependent methyltransferase [Thermoanaerobaculia bacterium]
MKKDAGRRLHNVSDTALWVAAYRAEESERADALFDDPYARSLAGRRGFDLLDAMPRGRKLSWPMVVRTALLDRMVDERLAAGADLVLNLAAGLDARPYRMQLPSDLLWIEVDLPGMIEHKETALAEERPVCRLERVALDLADGAARRRLLAEVAARCASALVITEGLLVYLDEADVTALADELHAGGSYRWWSTDLASPGLLKFMNRSWGREVGEAGAPFRFAPEKGPAFFEEHRWRPLEVHNNFYAAARLGRLPWFYALLARLFRERTDWNPKRVWGGICLFERAAPAVP